MAFGLGKPSQGQKCLFFLVGGGGWGRGVQYVFPYFLVFMFYIKFQVPSSSDALVLTETKGITDR